MLKKTGLLLFFTLFLSVLLNANPFSGGAKKNPFASSPKAEKQNQENADAGEKNKPAESQKQGSGDKKNLQEQKDDDPGVFSRIWRWFVGVQGKLNKYLTTKIKALKADFSIWTFFIVLFISVFYGFLHSIGPGHGKLVISSYFLKSESNMKDLVLLSGIISLIHNLSAGFISALLAFLSSIDVFSGQHTARGIAMLISGIILVVIGAYYLINTFKHDHGCCKQPLEAEKEHSHEIDPKKAKKIQKMSLWAVGFSAGIVPCPLSIAVIFFGLYLNAITIVIVSVIGMSIGMALTEFMFGYASMKVRTGILKVFKNNEKAAGRIHFAFGLAGSIIIILFGIFIGAAFFT